MKRSPALGFTLIELLLYFAIVSTLLLTLTAFFSMSVETRIKGQTISEVDQQGAYAMDQITQAIRNSNAFLLPTPGLPGSVLSLTMPLSAVTPTQFSLSGTTLQITEGLLGPVNLTNSEVQVTNLTFTNLTRLNTPGIMQVSFTLKRVNTAGRNEYDYQKTFTDSAERSW